MKRIYRGYTADYDPAQTAKSPFLPVQRSGAEAYTVTCRGMAYRITPSASSPAPTHSTAHKLICRGTTYVVQKTAEGTSYQDVVYGFDRPPARDLSFI
jgi:Domain of unknown function (DUF4278)